MCAAVITRMRVPILGALATAFVASGAGSALGITTGAGSTFAAAAYTKWCRESGLCNYVAIGSTGGLNALAERNVDFAGSDAVPTGDQLTKIEDAAGGAPPLYFPTLLGAITIPTNLPGVRADLRLDGDTLGRIFAGQVTRWNDPALARTNAGVRLPNAPITVCVRADGSGTSFGFSRYLAKVSPTFKSKVSVGQTPNWGAPALQRGDGNRGVADCIKSHPSSIGYVDLADAVETGLARRVSAIGQRRTTTARVVRGGKRTTVRKAVTVFIRPSGASISAAGNVKIPPDLLVDPSNSPAPRAYPITVTTWILTYGDYAGTGRDLAGPRAFLDYVYGPTAQGELQDLGYAPLPAALLAAAKAQLAKLR
jgi:phosphate transport system substrate-binding protein